MLAAWAGSSPLARGLPEPIDDELDRRRIIPARAGFTVLRGPGHLGRRDHPRSRGVYLTPPLVDRGSGSSPLARGLLHDEDGAGGGGGIIPARAGFTPIVMPRRSPTSDHPRSRGVYISSNRPPLTHLGSSPLARGLPPRSDPGPELPRIIPARAGFTLWRRARSPPRKDHPRSRGVYSAQRDYLEGEIGSSPLARGLLLNKKLSGRECGIIPARAGFTSPAYLEMNEPQDHPRSRGVYAIMMRLGVSAMGSSPLARGLRLGDRGPIHFPGIIPARAGFTYVKPPRYARRTDHPRSRGVYTRASSGERTSTGSSPLARGLRDVHQGEHHVLRIIPARAGFTRPRTCPR